MLATAMLVGVALSACGTSSSVGSKSASVGSESASVGSESASVDPKSLTWTKQSPTTTPEARSAASMAYDPKIGKIVLFGGYASTFTSGQDFYQFNDTWTYDGTTWTKQSPTTSPPARAGAAMAYDPKIGKIVLFGGYSQSAPSGRSNDTWTYEGTTWTQQHVATSPSEAGSQAMAYDPSIGKIVLVASLQVTPYQAQNETWLYDGTTWTRQVSALGPGAEGSAITYDAALRKIVLFETDPGMYQQSNRTWTYDRAAWTEQHPATSPPPRGLASLGYDPAIGRTVLFGGTYSVYRTNEPRNDTWTFDGSTWTPQSRSTVPPPGNACMEYDPNLKSLVLFSGFGNGSVNETWTYGPLTGGGG